LLSCLAARPEQQSGGPPLPWLWETPALPSRHQSPCVSRGSSGRAEYRAPDRDYEGQRPPPPSRAATNPINLQHPETSTGYDVRRSCFLLNSGRGPRIYARSKCCLANRCRSRFLFHELISFLETASSGFFASFIPLYSTEG